MQANKAVVIAGLAVALVVRLWADVPVEPEGAANRFSGGSYDGWDQQITATSVVLDEDAIQVFLSSGAHQVFDFTATPVLADVLLQADDPKGAITNGGVIRISVPSEWVCNFNNTVVPTITGVAVNKIGTPAYSVDGKTLELPVTLDFEEGDNLVISGLTLSNLRLVSPGINALELDFDGDGVRDSYDSYLMAVRAIWAGGAYDGWDAQAMEGYGDILPPLRSTLISIQ